MLCEIDLAQPPAGLYPGAFVQTRLPVHGLPRLLLPTEALLGQGGQLFVALVEEGKVHFQRVRLGVDDGAHVEVLDGLRGGELVALTWARVPDGAPVRSSRKSSAKGDRSTSPGMSAWKSVRGRPSTARPAS